MLVEAHSAAVTGVHVIPKSWVHRKWLGNYGDLEGLLASVLLSSLGDARGVVVRQHCCERRRISFVGGAKIGVRSVVVVVW